MLDSQNLSASEDQMSNYHSKTYAAAYRPDHLNIRKIDKFLKPRPRQKILEIGCSKGALVQHYRSQGVDMYGVDINPESVKLANNDFVKHQAQPHKLDFPTDFFDGLLAIHVIEHIPQLRQILAEVSRVVKARGQIFFMYPAEPIQGLYAVYAASILLHNPFKARQIHCHQLTPKKLQKHFTNALDWTHCQSKFYFFPLPQFAHLYRNRHKKQA